MKKILFISRSTLPHNLLRAVLPLVNTPVDLTCMNEMEELSQMTRRGRPFHMVLIDYNALGGGIPLEKILDQLKKHPQLKESSFILIHAKNAPIARDFFEKAGFWGIYAKPFSSIKLAEMISKTLKGER